MFRAGVGVPGADARVIIRIQPVLDPLNYHFLIVVDDLQALDDVTDALKVYGLPANVQKMTRHRLVRSDGLFNRALWILDRRPFDTLPQDRIELRISP